MNQVRVNKPLFHQIIDECLINIKVYFASGSSGLSKKEYEQLCMIYLAMLGSVNDA